ncbi:dUTP diphosphatase [Alkalihalobacterium chitinilyticum]|uniref:dUTP diphosphatase n=1 Tax=Alkalihalobacterium chitinilyticum TaxID=2980103 RepID=A0ABT5VA75_9BACI|nr:dUTP diphosphatase [Alkalihalobacterium chitinilyticum]MDE5412360.1 dUTP diphosphatase [Alkalihalobacterium chitinilyticum]
MIVNLKKLFDMQRQLNERIIKEHKLEERNLLAEQILALEVELGELANETRCFKYWSNKPPAERHIILEEYVDGLHFILSLGIVLEFEDIQVHTQREEKTITLVQAFQRVYDIITKLHEQQTFESYKELFDDYLILGEKLGFSTDEMEQAYYDKNEVNHRRQDEGY